MSKEITGEEMENNGLEKETIKELSDGRGEEE